MPTNVAAKEKSAASQVACRLEFSWKSCGLIEAKNRTLRWLFGDEICFGLCRPLCVNARPLPF
jgi:hypothetical protein